MLKSSNIAKASVLTALPKNEMLPDLLGPGSQCCFFMTGQQSTESFYCGTIIRILPAPIDKQTRYRIEFYLVKETIKSDSIETFEGLTRGQHHVYY
jgi:hypothetical protein